MTTAPKVLVSGFHTYASTHHNHHRFPRPHSRRRTRRLSRGLGERVRGLLRQRFAGRPRYSVRVVLLQPHAEPPGRVVRLRPRELDQPRLQNRTFGLGQTDDGLGHPAPRQAPPFFTRQTRPFMQRLLSSVVAKRVECRHDSNRPLVHTVVGGRVFFFLFHSSMFVSVMPGLWLRLYAYIWLLPPVASVLVGHEVLRRMPWGLGCDILQ